MERLEEAYVQNESMRQKASSLFSFERQVFDIFAISAVAVLLFLVTKTHTSFQNQLVLFYDNPAPHAFYTTHFVHESAAHLRGNLISYLVVVPLTYLISLRAGRHREFRLGFLAILFVLPPIISLVSLLGLDLVIQTIFGFDPNVRSSRGFSALAGAFVGMLMVAVADLFRDIADREGSLWPVIGLMFWYGIAVAFWGVFQYLVSLLTVLLVLLPTAYAVWLVKKVEGQYNIVDGMQAGGWLRGRPVTVGLLGVGFFATVWGTQGLLAFPWFEGGTNTLSHFVGILSGISLMIFSRPLV
ncbi:hypothetical protein M0R89_07455 [Halorussus limi]|uniref:Peptidase S54 rhomboid domain-containing protein n=1 Tax=Halorussus limi TaxID=2938695 RepID=A0A8U0HXK9_9EURY|nr:hypothetical protein [Halorussus limi]UPV75885.1 hypothetical protein M0R89_07455 [Halorussus limi]